MHEGRAIPNWATTHPAIWAWGTTLGSSRDYILRQIDEAQADDAPRNAIYRKSEPGGGKTIGWATMADIKPAAPCILDLRAVLGDELYDELAGVKAAPEYPEHEKLAKVQPETQAAHDFLEWLGGKGIMLARVDERGMALTVGNDRDLLAEWKGVDLAALEAEKRAMIERVRTPAADR
jgi:hypothetical protein